MSNRCSPAQSVSFIVTSTIIASRKKSKCLTDLQKMLHFYGKLMLYFPYDNFISDIGKETQCMTCPQKESKVIWQKVLASPFIFWIMAIPPDSVMALISTSLLLVMSSLSPLRTPHLPFSVSIACGIIFAIGCGIGGLALANILERLFPDFPTVQQWKWVQWVPSAFGVWQFWRGSLWC